MAYLIASTNIDDGIGSPAFMFQVKLMNGEKAAFQTPTFALKRQRTLDTLIRDIYAEHCSDHKVVSFSISKLLPT